ncbi:MAG: hypothetical protein FJ146_07580 [Deltaproteobacteria bacterium]|nr:hypothetical protein [Deltaproteobacteria bacterium]
MLSLFSLGTAIILSLTTSAVLAASPDADSVTTDLQGTWILGCQSYEPSTSWPPDESRSAKWTYTFVGDEFKWLEEEFSDAACKVPLMNQIIEGKFVIGEAITSLDNVFAFDMVNVRDTFTLMDPSKRVYDYCRGGDYVLTGTSACDYDNTYQIIRVEGNKLRFGRFTDMHDGNTPVTRPLYLSTRVFTRP